ncbi:hypothetical protein QUA71_06895 [Microcoleus sp. MON1_C5]|uniref:hypothetical protein n=1 Tax=Microcoleus sp. MON1_C5 TaxID=2818828 RepID=UPI002FD4FADD
MMTPIVNGRSLGDEIDLEVVLKSEVIYSMKKKQVGWVGNAELTEIQKTRLEVATQIFSAMIIGSDILRAANPDIREDPCEYVNEAVDYANLLIERIIETSDLED